MGNDAEVFVFDHARHVDEVVPAIVDLVRTARIGTPWLAWFAAYDPEGMALLRQHRVDLEEHCTFLGPDLRHVGVEDGRSRFLGHRRFCGSATCPVRDRCPLHETSAESVVHVVEAAFDAAVTLRCLGPSQFVGRSNLPSRCQGVLERLGASTDPRLRELLDALARRGSALREVHERDQGEGIHGWLTADETAELALHLDELPLPRYEPSFERMKALQREPLAGADEMARRHGWEELSLSFVRTTAVIAADRGKGILWGNDVSVGFMREEAARYEQVRLEAGGGSGPG